jgi:hypothetical protein
MEMAQDDMMLVGEVWMDHVGRRRSGPFSEAIPPAAMNCQNTAVRNDGHAHRGDKVIIDRLGQSREGGVCRAWNRWRLRASWGGGVAHLIPNIATTFLVELDDLHDSKRILLLIGLGNPAVL